MCNYTNTHFEACGCTLSTQTEMCGYQDDDFSECMKWTVIKESDPRKGQCGRSTCKYEAPVATVPEKEAKWTVKEVSVTPPIVEEEQQTATVA